MDEFNLIMTQSGKDIDQMADVVADHSYEVFKGKGDTYMARGFPLDSNALLLRLTQAAWWNPA